MLSCDAKLMVIEAYMKFLLIKAMAEAHPYSQFAMALRGALRELGHHAVISDQSAHVSDGAATTEHLVRELQADAYDVVLSFSSFFGSVGMQDGRSFFDAIGVKFVGWQLDHPIYAPQSLTRSLQNRFAVYANRNHLRYAEAVKLPGRGVTLLPGGDLPSEQPREHCARDWGVFIAATYRAEPVRTWEQAKDSPGKRLMAGVVDRLLADREASLVDAFNETSTKLRLGAKLGVDPDFDAQMRDFLCQPLTYVRNWDRIQIVRALVEAGLPVTICGDGWQQLFGHRENLTYLEPVDFRDLPRLYGKARVVINLNAGNGGSERAVHAALAGAAVVSDFSRELDGLMGGGEGVAFFNRAKSETAARVAAGLLEGDRGETVARRGFERVAAKGLWRHRAEQLTQFVA